MSPLNAFHARSTAVTPAAAVDVVCAWPVSGQYGPGSRILYYVLVATCILGRRVEWLRNAALAVALVFPAVAALHALVLAALHVNGALFSPPSFPSSYAMAPWPHPRCNMYLYTLHTKSNIRNRCRRYGYLWRLPTVHHWHSCSPHHCAPLTNIPRCIRSKHYLPLDWPCRYGFTMSHC